MQNIQSKLRILIASLLVLGLILGYQLFTATEAPRVIDRGDQSTQIDFFVRDGIVTRWSAQGNRESVTSVEYAEHLEFQKLSTMDHPFAVGYNPEGRIVHTLSAESGIYPDDNSRIDLAGRVELHHNPDTEQDTALFTEALTYFPDTGLVQSAEPVEFLNNQGQTTAEGMEFYTRENRVELLSRVRGVYVPSNQN